MASLPPILVLGLCPGSLAAPPGTRERVVTAQVLAGGQRLLAAFPDFAGERIPVTGPLDLVLDRLEAARNQGLQVAVLADGDPLFFGLGARLAERFGPQALAVFPAVSAVQIAAAHFSLPWAGIPVVSLHGRDDPGPLLAALTHAGRAFVYTDTRNTPASLSRLLHDLSPGTFTLTVFEDLDTPDERVRRLTPEDAADLTFSALNLVLAEQTKASDHPLSLGLPDQSFATQQALITKGPVRAVALAALSLTPDSRLWDLGAGCGSVSIEAAALLPRGTVHALEKDPARLDLIRANIRRFGAWQVQASLGQAPAALAALPDPDRIFLGGGLHRSPETLAAAFDRLPPGGILVASCILLDSLALARDFFASRDTPAEVTLIQAAQSRPLAQDLRLEAFNPVFLVRAVKP